MLDHERPIVLMADDDADDCMLAKDAFQETKAQAGFFCVEDGDELMSYLFSSVGDQPRAAEQRPLPALILLDLNMPRKDGRQALSEIKSVPAFRNIPIVVLTTSREEKDIVFSREMGAESFITKPNRFDQWIQMMNDLADRWLRSEQA